MTGTSVSGLDKTAVVVLVGKHGFDGVIEALAQYAMECSAAGKKVGGLPSTEPLADLSAELEQAALNYNVQRHGMVSSQEVMATQ